MICALHRIVLSLIVFTFCLIAGCGGGGGGATTTATVPTTTPLSYTLSVTVTGLNGPGLVLQNKASDNLSVSTSSTVSFATQLMPGASYLVTVFTQPTGQTCTVSNGTGTISNESVNNVAVTCSALPIAPVVFTPLNLSSCAFDASLTVGDYTVASDPWGIRNQISYNQQNNLGPLTYTFYIPNPVATLYVGGTGVQTLTTSTGTFTSAPGYQFQTSDLQTKLPAPASAYATCITAATTGTTSQTGATASWTWNFGNLNIPVSGGLSAYPEIGWTPKGANPTPIPTNSNYNLAVTYNITPSIHGNVLLESWIGTNPVDDGNCSACNNPVAEIGLKLEGEVADCGVNPTTSAVIACQMAVIDGHTFYVVGRNDSASNTNGLPRYFVQFISPTAITNATIHMNLYVTWALQNNPLDSNGAPMTSTTYIPTNIATYVKSVQLGTELGISSTDTVTVSSFSVSQ